MTNQTHQHDTHLAGWLKAKFNLTVQWNEYRTVRNDRYVAFKGDWDLDTPYVTDDTIFATALEYGACYDGDLFDELVAIELGKRPALEQLKELLGAA